MAATTHSRTGPRIVLTIRPVGRGHPRDPLGGRRAIDLVADAGPHLDRVTPAATFSSSRPSTAQALRAVIANRSVRDTQLALAITRAVDLAQLVVVSALLFAQGGAAPVAVYGVVRTLGSALGVPVVTALGCRQGPATLLRAMGVVAAAGSLAMAAVIASGGPTIGVLVSAALVGVAVGCFRPVIAALTPSLTRSPAELLASNAANGLLEGACTLVGPVLGAFVGVLLGPPALLAMTGGGLLIAGHVAGRVPDASSLDLDREANTGGRIGEYTAGARELAANPAARLVTLLGAAQTFIRGAMSVVVVVFTIDVLRTGSSGVGALYGAMGVGGLVGLPLAFVVVNRIGVHRSIAIGLAAWGAPLAVCALTASPLAALVLFAVIGVGNGVVDIGYYGALQRVVAARVLTRVLGVVESMFQAGLAAGAFAGAVLLDQLGPRSALLAIGLVLPALASLATPRLWAHDRVLGERDRAIGRLRREERFAHLPMSALDHLVDRAAPIGVTRAS